MCFSRRRRIIALETCEDRRLLTIEFAVPSHIATTEHDFPFPLLTNDFDLDGDIDVAVASANKDVFSWYENLRSGEAFNRIGQRVEPFVDSILPISFDANGDGTPDIIASNVGDLLLFENSLSNFTARFEFPKDTMVTDARKVKNGDLNGDLRDDLVLIQWDPERKTRIVSWAENIGGNFGVPIEISVMPNAGVIAIGDVDSDARMDIVVGSAGQTSSLIRNLGNGEFAEPQMISTQINRSLSFEDIDGDGDIDLAGAYAHDAYWHENLDSKGTFSDGIKVVEEMGDLRAGSNGDFDQDGDRDLVFVDFDNHLVYWFENPGDRSENWNRHLVADTQKGPISVLAVDIDNDDDQDIVVASAHDDTAAWYRNIDGVFSGPNLITGGVGGEHFVTTADLDGDGDKDLLNTAFDDGEILWYENVDGNAEHLQQRTISMIAEKAVQVHPADLDGDGDLDVLSASFGNGNWSWYRNDGHGNFSEQILFRETGNASSITAGDLDGDGDLDVVVSNFGNLVTWFENLDGKGDFAEASPIDIVARGTHLLRVEDVDLDGDLDIIAGASFVRFGREGNRILWYENDGSGNFNDAYFVLIDDVQSLTWFDIADFDSDGDIDVVASSFIDNTVAWFENTHNKEATWTMHVISLNAVQAQSVVARDIDGDGDFDAVVANYGDDQIVWHENLGSGQFDQTPEIITDELLGPTRVFADDIDLDGDTDVIAVAHRDNTLALLRNESAPLRGDIDDDGIIEPADLDQVCAAIHGRQNDDQFDIDKNGSVDRKDVADFLTEIANTVIGDVNFDGRFDSSDLVRIFQTGLYEQPFEAKWSEGDWNCDGRFTTSDLVYAFSEETYTNDE